MRDEDKPRADDEAPPGCLCDALCAALGLDPNDDSVVCCGEELNIWCLAGRAIGVGLITAFIGFALYLVFGG